MMLVTTECNSVRSTGVTSQSLSQKVDHMFRQVDLEQQRELRGKFVTREETLEVLTTIVRADPAEVPKLSFGDKLRAIDLAGKHHRLFTEQIEVKQSVDVNIELVELRATIHALVRTQQISECDAALKPAEALADVPELAAMCRELAVGSARKQLGPAHS